MRLLVVRIAGGRCAIYGRYLWTATSSFAVCGVRSVPEYILSFLDIALNRTFWFTQSLPSDRRLWRLNWLLQDQHRIGRIINTLRTAAELSSRSTVSELNFDNCASRGTPLIETYLSTASMTWIIRIAYRIVAVVEWCGLATHARELLGFETTFIQDSVFASKISKFSCTAYLLVGKRWKSVNLSFFTYVRRHWFLHSWNSLSEIFQGLKFFSLHPLCELSIQVKHLRYFLAAVGLQWVPTSSPR